MKKIINLTPHPIFIYNKKEELIKINPENVSIRLKEEKGKSFIIEGIEIFEVKRGIDLKSFNYKFEENIVYIVSSVVANELKNIFPGIIFAVPGEFIRDKEGNIIGCKNLYVLN